MEFNKLQIIISDVLEIDKNLVKMESVLAKDFRMDSLDLYRICIAIEEEFQVSIEEMDPEAIQTVGDIYKYLAHNP